MKEKDISKKRVASQIRPPKPIHLIACSAYSGPDYFRFLKHEMSEDEIQRFGKHIDDCPFCASELKSADDQLKQSEYQRYFEKTIALLDRIDVRNRFKIIFQLGRNFIDILQTTGQILTTPQPIAVRSRDPAVSSGNTQCIVQNFGSPPVSVQVCLAVKTEDQTVELTVSLFDMEKEVFIPYADIYFNAPGMEQNLSTDAKGAASMLLPLPSPCSLRIYKNGEAIADIEIDSSVQAVRRPDK